MNYRLITRTALFTALLPALLFLGACKKDSNSGGCDVSAVSYLFPLSQDRTLGAQTAAQIAADPTTYPILDSVKYKAAYTYLYAMRDKILANGKLTNASAFGWKLHIIKDDNTQNAFCTPGGYIYVYTGLIKYLEHEDDLAGVLGHEMAHADQRHGTKSMIEQYGLTTLITMVTGGSASTIQTLAANLLNLKYSRCHEAEADGYSVVYLNGSGYACNGAASFFTKLIASGQAGSTPAFLSDHPDPGDRVTSINAKATSLGCSTAAHTPSDYAAFKTTIP